MPAFRVRISGTNLLMDVDGERSRHGFSVVRFVEAESVDAASSAALAMIEASPQMRGARNVPADPPVCWVDEVEELDSTAGPPTKQPGFAFRSEPSTNVS